MGRAARGPDVGRRHCGGRYAAQRAKLSFEGSLYPAAPPAVTVVDGTGTTPAGCLPLSLFGITPFTYGAVTGGADGYLTVGAENEFGNSGQNWYVNGSGTPVVSGSEVRVQSVPGAAGETHTITFTATGTDITTWTNCAQMVGNLFPGTSTACINGETTAP